MSESIYGNDLEREIILMEQELIFKRELLNKCREKLSSEISEHAQTKSICNKYMNENKELLLQLNACLAGTEKVEEENKKNREDLVKIQVQFNAYLTERQQVLDNCYKTEKQNNDLKSEVTQLKEKIKEHMIFMENITTGKSKTEALVAEIIKKQEILNKEQAQLENTCKEGLRFAEKLSEEAKFQIKYVQEAKINQAQMENEIIRLMAAISELKTEKEKSKNEEPQPENLNYLEMWKSHQRDMAIRIEELQEANKRLLEELNFTREHVEILMNNY